MPTAKVSVAIDEDALAWARSVARREGKSLSAVMTESLEERRRLAAMREVVDWLGEGQPPLTPEELADARRLLGLDARPVRPRRSKKKSASRRR